MVFPNKIFFKVFLVFILSASVCYADNSFVNPQKILLKHYETVGGLKKLKSITSGYAEGKNTFDGLEGTFKNWEEIPLKYRLEEDYGVIKQTFGDNGKQSWSVDTNGKVQIHRDEETLKRRKIKALLEVYDHVRPGTKNFIFTYKGEEKIGAIACHVVEMANIINDDITFFFFSKENYYLVKAIVKQPDFEIRTLFSDYRNINGIIHPFHEETEVFPREKKETIQLARYDFNTKINSSVFEPPEKDVEDFEFENGKNSETIPFYFVENNMYFYVIINGEKKLWLLDNGASMSIIDADYAKKLGLNPEGEIKGFGIANIFDFSFVTLPSYRVGEIRFNPQKIFSFKGLSNRLYDSTVVGILGHDFLSRFVVKIDYASKILTLYHPDKFKYNGSGAIIDAPMRERIFAVPVIVDGKYKGKWTLDIGAFDMSFNYPYAKDNNLLDLKGIERVSADLGGQHAEKSVRFKSVELGGYKVSNLLINVPVSKGKGSNDSREIIGNIGNKLLKHFVIYLDYKRQQVIVEKGKDFEKYFPEDKSGLLTGTGEGGYPEVVFVAKKTPAADAGFIKGDIIRKINGINVDSLGGVDGVRELFSKDEGTKYNIEVLQNGSIREFKLILKDLYK
ncbi:MAG: aspartyl protease family protein [Proteobacteria bacterium]|nr:aspartyl protease family protein [Pseudomonadota bacterium]